MDWEPGKFEHERTVDHSLGSVGIGPGANHPIYQTLHIPPQGTTQPEPLMSRNTLCTRDRLFAVQYAPRMNVRKKKT